MFRGRRQRSSWACKHAPQTGAAGINKHTILGLHHCRLRRRGAVAVIQRLNQTMVSENEALRRENAGLKQQNESLEKWLENPEHMVKSLIAKD